MEVTLTCLVGGHLMIGERKVERRVTMTVCDHIVGMTGLRDYEEWHKAYDDPNSGLSW